MVLAALPTKLELYVRAGHFDMPVLQRGEAEGTIGTGILIVPNANAGAIEEAYHCRQDLLTRQPRLTQIFLNLCPDAGQRLAECQDSAELGLVALLTPLWMI